MYIFTIYVIIIRSAHRSKLVLFKVLLSEVEAIFFLSLIFVSDLEKYQKLKGEPLYMEE